MYFNCVSGESLCICAISASIRSFVMGVLYILLVSVFITVVVIGLNPVTQEVIEGGVAVINMEILAGSLEKDVVVSLTSADESAEGSMLIIIIIIVIFSELEQANLVVQRGRFSIYILDGMSAACIAICRS